VASQVAGRTIVPGGAKQHVQGRFITLFIVRAESGLVGARLGVGDNLVHIQCATHNVQDTRLTPSFAGGIEANCIVGLCLHGPNPGTEPYVPEPGFNPDYTPPLPPPDDLDLTTSLETKRRSARWPTSQILPRLASFWPYGNRAHRRPVFVLPHMTPAGLHDNIRTVL